MRAVRLTWAIAALVMCGTAVHAQPAPNRSAEVAQILGTLGPVVESPTDDARRSALYTIARQLVSRGDCCWGVLVKTDQGNKVPADILVWRPTLEIFDIMTGGVVSPTWIPKGTIPNTAWIWQAADTTAPDPSTPPATTPGTVPAQGGPVVNLEPLQSHLDASIATALKVVTDAQAALLADEIKWRKEQQDTSAALLAAVNEPGWFSKFVRNPVVQALGAAAVGVLTTRQMMKPATIAAVHP